MARQFRRASVKTREGYNDYYAVSINVPNITGEEMDHPELGKVKVFAGYWYGEDSFDYRWGVNWHSNEEQAEILKALGFKA